MKQETFDKFRELEDKTPKVVLDDTMEFLSSKNESWGKLTGREVAFALLHCVFSVVFGMTNKKNAISLISFCLMSYIESDELLDMVVESNDVEKN